MLGGRLAVAQQGHVRGRRRHALGQRLLADERVDEGALAGVELARDDEQERLLQRLRDEAQRLVILRRGLEGAQAVAKLLREPPLLREKIHLAAAQDG